MNRGIDGGDEGDLLKTTNDDIIQMEAQNGNL